MITEHNVTTGEIIQRELTAAELKQLEKDQTEYAAKQAAAQTKATARQVIADRLGLTADELQVLLG
jgi:hypothetical protein